MKAFLPLISLSVAATAAIPAFPGAAGAGAGATGGRGDAESGQDFATLPGRVTIPAGQRFATVAITPLDGARDHRFAIVSPLGVHVGCPSRSLIVIRH